MLKMVHVVRPWILAALLIFAQFTNKSVTGVISYSSSKLLNLRNQLSHENSKDIWCNQYKKLVKETEPEIIKSKKRGKRSGIKTRLSLKKSRAGLPGILLTNAQSVLPKLDELHAIVKGRSKHLTQIICVTESWLSSRISENSTALDGYAQFRHDRCNGPPISIY